MSKSDPWTPFLDIVHAPLSSLGRWKQETGRKIIGHLLPDVPEELIYVAGALPVAVQGSGIQVSMAQTYIPGYTCSHAMGALEKGLRGELGVLDGMIIPYVCDTTRNLFHIWNQCFPDMNNEFLRLPKRLDYPGIRPYLLEEFSRIFQWACGLTGANPTQENLKAGLDLYEKSRTALKRAYKMQNSNPAEWTQARVQALFASALRFPRDEHLDLMASLPWDAAVQDSKERVPIYVRGKLWHPTGILEMFDSIGLLVAEDEVLTGFRQVSASISVEGTPLERLVDLHLARTPYAGYHFDPAKMVQDFLDRVVQSGAKGVLFLNPKFCEPAGFDTPDFQKALQGRGIPCLVIETSESGASREQILVRLEAFKEMLSGSLT